MTVEALAGGTHIWISSGMLESHGQFLSSIHLAVVAVVTSLLLLAALTFMWMVRRMQLATANRHFLISLATSDLLMVSS